MSLTQLQELALNHQRMALTSLGQIYESERQVMTVQLRANVNNEPVIIGYLVLSTDSAEFMESWSVFPSMFFLIALGVMVLTFALTFYTSKKQASPLNEMAGAARRFARGDFSIRVEDTGRVDEFGQLTQAFNAMADSLESSETFRRNFIANLSHELKTPMTVIAGFAEGLLDGTIPHENQEHYLGIVASETRRLSRLVESMLDITILESPDVDDGLDSSFDISEVARLALLSLSSKIEERGLDVETDLPEEAIITLGDKDSITQVIYNLLDNAIKFSNPKGIIGLRLWKQGGKAYVSVENSGRTIPPTELPHIFERFHKIDKSRGVDREGVGLGLYLVKTILDKHNEDIYVTSRDGQTKFMFTLMID
jgi:signal transduction histidine kinase